MANSETYLKYATFEVLSGPPSAKPVELAETAFKSPVL